jgi:uncharacterized membrane protein YcaP (DUF421 family)
VLFRSWDAVLRVALSAVAVYVLVVAALRLIGARALAKMSAYDLIVSIALGSLIASVPLSTAISVADGATAIITFLVLQELTRYLQSRYRAAHHLVRERPHLVVWDGKFIEDRLERIDASADEVRAAIRQAGLMSVDDVQAVVLENDGAWSVMRRGEASNLSALDGLDIPGHGVVESDGRRHGLSRDDHGDHDHHSDHGDHADHGQRPPASSVAGQV